VADWQSIAVLGLPLVGVAALWSLMRGRAHGRVLVGSALAVYALALFAVTLTPFPVEASALADMRSSPLAYQAGTNLVPFASIRDLVAAGAASTWRQVGGNFVLLMPLTFLAPFLWPRMDRLRSAVLLALLVSLGIEAAQAVTSTVLGFGYKVVDVDDVILNVAGGLVGFGLYRIATRRWITAPTTVPTAAASLRD